MINLLLFCLITSLQLTAVHAAFSTGMIFGRVGHVMNNNLPAVICMPLFDCLVCMGGIWTIVKCMLTQHSIAFTCSAVLTVVGINVLITAIVGRLNNG